jgi:hypothetical protein
MSDLNKEIDDMIKENKRTRFESELGDTIDEERKNHLNEILNKILNKKPIIDEKSTLLSYFEEINKNIVLQSWNKLNPIIKNKKIEEYISERYQDDKLIALEKINNIINKGLLTNKYIQYDSKIGKISDIPNFKKENNEYIFNIEKKIIKKKINS